MLSAAVLAVVAVAVVGSLLLAEPDMGAFMVIAVIAMGILFLGGVNARMFFLIAAVMTFAFVLMIALSDWRRERIFAYLDPWNEKYTDEHLNYIADSIREAAAQLTLA